VKQDLTFREAIALAHRVGIKDEHDNTDRGEHVLDLDDGSSLHFESNHDCGGSEYTPEGGIEPPTVYLVAAAKPPVERPRGRTWTFCIA
jgi:hypothetical protein